MECTMVDEIARTIIEIKHTLLKYDERIKQLNNGNDKNIEWECRKLSDEMVSLDQKLSKLVFEYFRNFNEKSIVEFWNK